MVRFKPLAVVLMFVIQTQGAAAQGMALPPDVSADDCEQLAAMPNAPISVESCKAMFGLAAQMEAAAADPRGRRPGDETMTCAQIFSELKTMAGVGLTEANRVQAEAMVAEGNATAARSAAEMTTFMAETTAIGIAMAAMGPYVPNFVGAAIVAAWQAQTVALAARRGAEQKQLGASMSRTIGAATSDLAQSMQANPRFARLGQLALQRECEAPALESK